MSLEVIGAGFGRTGTMSLKVSLEELGFGPCYHMSEVFEHLEHVEFWEKLGDRGLEPLTFLGATGAYAASMQPVVVP